MIRDRRVIRSVFKLIFVLLTGLLVISPAQAQSPAVDNGLSWLRTSQQADGSWGSLSSFRDTAAVVDSYRLLGLQDSSLQNAVQWIGRYSFESNDFLAKRIQALTGTGINLSNDVQQLLSSQNPDGGWGYSLGFDSDILDTVIALSALDPTLLQYRAPVTRGISYLVSKQNSEGSWSIVPDSAGEVTTTSRIVVLMKTSRSTLEAAAAVAKAVAWLTTKQNSDGGFGSSPSTVHDTVNALSALLMGGNLQALSMSNAFSYIASSQLPDGSWNESAYETALAIKTIGNIRPNLAILQSDLTASTASPRSGEEVIIRAIIRNIGTQDAANVAVQFSIKASDGTITKLGAPRIIPLVAIGAFLSEELVFDTTGKQGPFDYMVTVDPENIISELSKDDNQASLKITVIPVPDLVISSDTIILSKNTATIGDDVTISATIENHGNASAQNFQVAFYHDAPTPANLITTSSVDNLDPAQSIVRSSTWKAGEAGIAINLYVVVDPQKKIAEVDKGNNQAAKPIDVVANTTANLTVTSSSISFSPPAALQGGMVEISALIRNDGFAEADGVDVAFYKGVPGQGGVLLATSTISSIAAGASATATYTWTGISEGGDKIIFVKVDPANKIQEFSKTDNDSFAVLKISSLPDFTIPSSSILITPVNPKDGETVFISATVRNIGDQSASDIVVSAGEGGTIVGSQVIPAMDGNAQMTISFAYNTTGKSGLHEITLVVDPDNAISEQNKSNNSASKSFSVQNSELWVSEQYISPNGDGVKESTQIFFKLDVPATVSVAIVNKKEDTVRTYSGGDLVNTGAGSVTWEGLDVSGKVVDDGEYKVQIKSTTGSALKEATVVVDTNRSSLAEALATDKLVKNDLSCRMPPETFYSVEPYFFYFDRSHTWLADGSGILYTVPPSYGSYMCCSPNAGLFLMSPEGKNIQKLTSDERLAGKYIDSFSPSPDSQKIALIVHTQGTMGYERAYELWVMDRDGNNLTLLDSRDPNSVGDSYALTLRYSMGMEGLDNVALEWSLDNQTITYPVYWWYGQLFGPLPNGATGSDGVTVNVQTGVRTTIISGTNYYPALQWSPDGNLLSWLERGQYGYNLMVSNKDGSNKRGLQSLSFSPACGHHWLNNSLLLTCHIFSGNPHRIIDILDVNTGRTVLYKAIVGTWYVSPQRDKLAFTDANGSSFHTLVSVHDLNDLKNVIVIDEPNYYLSNFQFSSDGGKIAYMAWMPSDTRIVIQNIDAKKTMVVDNEAYGSNFYSLLDGFLWMGDSNDILVPINLQYPIDDYNQAIFIVDTDSGEKRFLTTGFISGQQQDKIIFYGPNDTSPACIPKSYNDTSLWVMSSAANLAAELMAIRSNSQIALRGTADDLNFEGYKIEYAALNEPDQWLPVISYSDVPVLDGLFTTWVPPYEGTFYVKLTVWDKAGNIDTSKQRVYWASSPADSAGVTNFYKSTSLFSPNGDGDKDTVELHYKVLRPTHLDFSVSDENNKLLKSYSVDHPYPVETHISWDGRDESGTIMPEGKYKIRVFDFEFIVEIDNTLPVVSGGFNSADWFSPAVKMAALARDKNIKEWRIEKSDIASVEKVWEPVYSGGGELAEYDMFGHVYPVDLGSFHVSQLTGKEFKITGGDTAGNKKSSIFNAGEWIFISSSLPVDGKFQLKAIETIINPIQHMTVQWQYPPILFGAGPWNDDKIILNESNTLAEQFSLIWDYSRINLKPILFRVKAVNVNGKEFYSNLLGYADGQFFDPATKNRLMLTKITPPSPEDPDNYILEGFHNLENKDWTLHIDNSPVKKVPEWATFQSIPLPSAGIFKVKVDKRYFELCREYYVRFSATSVDSTVAGNYQKLMIPCIKFSHEYAEAQNCSTLSQQLKIKTTIDVPDLLGYELVELSIGVSKSSSPLVNESAINAYRVPSPVLGQEYSATMDVSSLPAGTYSIFEVLKYKNRDLQNILVDNEIATYRNLLVDTTLPTAKVTYPDSSTTFCAGAIAGQNVETLGIPVQGIARDDTNVKNYKLFYGVGDASASIPTTIEGTEPVEGQLGVWNIPKAKETSYSFKLKVADVVGNVSCYTTKFTQDSFTEILDIAVDKNILSLGGNVSLRYRIDEYATVDEKVFKVTGSALDTTPVRTLITGRQHLRGSETTIWDGKSDAGTPVSDGRYGIAVSAADSCDNTTQKWAVVEVDNTLPTAIITYPKQGDLPGNIVEVKGTADDLHFSSYILEAGQGEAPDTWAQLASLTTPVKDGILGQWNTYGLAGKWTLRVAAVDSAGNKNETRVTIDLGTRQNLIKALDIASKLVSPNNDGKLETASISYELVDICDIKIEIVDGNGLVRNIYNNLSLPSGIHSQIWDATDNTGSKVIDGLYSIRLTAVLSRDTSINQVESVTVVVDTTAPVADIQQPGENAVVKNSITVNGTISDRNLSEYSVTLTGTAGTVLLDQGNQTRENYVFGTLNNLAEGDYTLAVKSTDLGKNETNKNIIFTIDRTPPVVKLDTPKEGEYYGANKNVLINGSIVEKNIDTISLRYGTGASPALWTNLVTETTVTAYPQQFTWNVGKIDGKNDNIDDGVYVLSLYAKDKAGDSSEARVKLIIDNTLPTAAITSLLEGAYVKQAVDVKGTAFDQNLDKYTLEISEGQCSSSVKWAQLKSATSTIHDGVLGAWQALPLDGDYCIRLTALDKVGLASEAKVNVKVDTNPPAAPVLAGKVEDRTSVHLTWSGNTETDFAGYNLYRNGQKINVEFVAGGDLRDQNLSEGVYTYTVKAVDVAGWESQFSNEVTLRIDLNGPDARIRSPQDSSRAGGLVDIIGMAYSADDFKQYRVSIGQGASPSSWTIILTSPLPTLYGVVAQWDTLGLAEGQVYTVKLEAEDISGNVTTHTVSVTIDSTPPAAPNLISAITVTNSADVALTWQANTETDLAGYLLYRNDQLANVSGMVVGDLKPYLISASTTTYRDKSLPDGTFTYYMMAMDQTGNISDQSNLPRTVTIDTHPPRAKIVDPANKIMFGGKIMVKANSPDLDIASVQFQYQSLLSSPTITTDWVSLGSSVTTASYITYMDPSTSGLGLEYGDYRLRAVATDKGQKTDTAPGFITVTYTDLTPPAAPSGLSSLVSGGTVTLTWTAQTESDLNGYNVYKTSGSVRTRINTELIKAAPQPTYHDSGLGVGTYSYDVTAVDKFKNESLPSETVSAKVYAPVLAQPYTPVGQSTIQVQGINAAANSTVSIFGDTVSGLVSLVTTTADATGHFASTLTLTLGENTITARAMDSSGNVSKDANKVVVVYNDAPSAPAGLTAAVQDHDVHLAWNLNPETDILGYNLYRDGIKVIAPDVVVPFGMAASSYYYSPWAAMDNDQNSYWMPENGTSTASPAWWEMDLAAPELMSHLEIHWGTDLDSSGNEVAYAGKDFEIQVWSADANAWITQAKVTGNAVKNNVFDFKPAYRTDKVRIFITDSTDVNSAKQVRLAEVGMLKDNLVTFATTSTPSYDDLNLLNKQYGYTVTAVDIYGFESWPTSTVSGDVSVTPPSAPVLTALVMNSDVILTWTASPGTEAAGYTIYKNTSPGWTKIGALLVPETTFVDANLLNGAYNYQVTASDAVGNEGPPSIATAIVAAAPPTQPASLTISPVSDGALNASWGYNGLLPAGFNLYRGLTSGGPYAKVANALISGTSYLDTGLTSGVTYYYVITAVDLIGNEGGYSNEASGISLDTVAPLMPVILIPTMAGVPITLLTGTTNVSGTADPDAFVDLFRNGVFVGRTATQLGELVQNWPLDHDGNVAALSPDGNTLAYTLNDAIWFKSLVTGVVTQAFQATACYTLIWSPDGKKVAYTYYDSNWNGHIGIYDLSSGSSMLLPTGADDSEDSPSWSTDGSRLVFVQGGTAPGIRIMDLVTGTTSEVVSSNSAYNVRLSPDGNLIAYTDSQGLSLFDLVSNATRLVDSNADSYSFEWSYDGSRFAFISYRNGIGAFYVLNIADGTETLVPGSSNDPYYLAWTADGQFVVFAIWDSTDERDTLWMADVQAQTAAERIMPDLQRLWSVGNARGGAILFINQDALGNFTAYTMKNRIGSFTFSNVALSPGENLFTSVSSDASGNNSAASDAVSVTFDTSTSLNLSVSSDDVYLYPPYPIAGQQVSVNAVVTNASQTDIQNVEVTIYVWNTLGQLELLKSETIPFLEAGSSGSVTTMWDSTGKIGDNRLIVVVDQDDKIAELNESNNLAIKDFYVADKVGMSMTTALDAAQYSSQNANISVIVRNTGPAAKAVLDVRIEDANGYPVSLFDSKTMNLAYANETTQNYAWNTGSTYAGGYVVHSVLKDTSGFTLAENTAPFTIIADSALDLTVVTDKAAYGPGENVVTSFTIRNSGTNSIIPALQATVSVSDAIGTVLFTEVKAKSNLLPGAAIDLSSLWNRGLTVPGNYTATVQVTFEGGTAVAKSAAFKINESLVLAGTITVSPSIVAVGNIAQVAYTVTNSGNADALAHTTKIVVLDPEAQTIMQSSEETADIAENTGKSGQLAINTTDYGLKTYVAVLQSLYQGTTKNLASVSFTVNDLTPPVVAVTSPNADGLYRSTIILSVLASDNASGVDTVEYQIGDGVWKQLPLVDPASGRYGTSWEPASADNGPQTVYFRATDKAGNTSTPVPVGFTIDTIPPVLTLSTLADGSYTNNSTLNIAGTATDNIAVQAVTINDAPVTLNAAGSFSQAVTLAEGSNTIITTASDTAGNTTMDTRTIILDQTAPVITITNPADNSVTNKADIEVTGFIDTPSTIGIAVNGVTLPDIISGTTFTFRVTLVYGQNTIEVTTTDIATNSSTAKRTVVLDNLSPALAVTSPSQDITTNKAGILLQGTVDDLTGITVMITHDGTTYTPAVVNGMFEQQLAFIEEKQYPVIVTATDEAQNSSTVQRNIIYDKTPPVLSIDPVKTPTNSSQLVVTGTMEAGSTVTIACPTATIGMVSYPTDTTWQVIVAAMTEGENGVNATATDQAGNVSSPVIVIIAVDTQAPDTIIVSGPAALTNNSNALFTFLSTEDGSIFACRLDNGEYAECTSSSAFNGIFDGDHTFQVRATDPAGNTDQTAAVLFWTVDTIPPFAVITGTPDSPTRVTTALITIQGGDAVAYRYRLDSGGYSAEIALPTPIVLNNLTGGMHTLSVIARDSAGNWQPETNATTAAWTVDVQPPALTVSTLADGSITNNATLNIAGTATDNIAIQAVKINDTAITINADGSFSQALKLITGSNKITTVAMDTAGNTTTDVRTIVLDQTSPVITIIEPADNSLTNYADIVVTGTVDKTAKVTIKLNGISTGLEIVTESSFTFPVTLAYGQNLIEVTAVDLATNSGTAKRTVTFDNISPALAVTYPAQDITTNQSSIVLQGTVADLTGMIVTVTMDGTTYTPEVVDGTFQHELNFTEEKQYPAVVTATDAAGNSSMVQRNIIYDKTPPVLSIDPVKTPTNSSQQVMTGTMETGSTVTIVCPTATIGLVSYPTDTTWQMIVAAMTEGENLITATATDKTGNISNPVNAAILMDTHAPVTTADPAAGVYTTALTVTLTPNEQATTYFTTDGTTPSISSAVYSTPILISSSTTIKYFSIDAAGNYEAVKSAVYTLNSATKKSTTLTYTGPQFIAQGYPVSLSAALRENGTGAPNLEGRTITISLGSQWCTDRTNASGNASCTISAVKAQPGLSIVSATFTGDENYLPSSDSASVTVFAYPSTGAFVIGDKNAVINKTVTFWGSRWAKKNSVSNGSVPSSFKGYADLLSAKPMTCGVSWTSNPGRSPNPPANIPLFMGVIVSSKITKSGSTISGNSQEIVVVRTNANYGPDPGHAGTGTVVGVICSSSPGCDHDDNDHDDNDHHDNDHDDNDHDDNGRNSEEGHSEE